MYMYFLLLLLLFLLLKLKSIFSLPSDNLNFDYVFSHWLWCKICCSATRSAALEPDLLLWSQIFCSEATSATLTLHLPL